MPVYFIHQEECGQWLMKIGHARDLGQRLRQLQTGNPKQLTIVGWIVSENDVATERALHRKYEEVGVGGEWFLLQPADILDDLRDSGIRGFAAKNIDPFEVVGHDRKGIPEYMGVWDWADLEIDECCPYCGCMCGMHFQDASQMFHCLQCDELTNFSELSPDIETEEDHRLWLEMETRRKAALPKPRPRKRFVT